MKKRIFLTSCAALLALVTHAFSASFSDAIVAQLTQQGFADIAVETTWLGRVRIIATRSDGLREIILNPSTGEILRDLWTTTQGQTAYSLVDPVGSMGGVSQQSANIDQSSGETGEDTDQSPSSQDETDGGDDNADTQQDQSDDTTDDNKSDDNKDTQN